MEDKETFLVVVGIKIVVSGLGMLVKQSQLTKQQKDKLRRELMMALLQMKQESLLWFLEELLGLLCL